MTTRRTRRNNRRNNRNVNRHNRGHTAQSNDRTRRSSIEQAVLSYPDNPPSIVDSDESSNFSFSSAAEDYIANLAENESCSNSSDVVASNAPRESSPPPPMRHPVVIEGLRAYDLFSDPGRIELHYVCRPDKSAVFRLALHKAAEGLGATSESVGKGKDRKVVMTMETDHEMTLSRDEFGDVLHEIVENLFGAPKKSGKEKQKDRRRRVQMERRQRKMESFLDERITTGDLRSSRSSSKKNKKTGSAPEQRVGRTNVGYGMLERMGWAEGQGLGAEGEGLREPLEAERRRTRAGLGS